MVRIAVTGGIGSGKSHVCALLEKKGFPVYYADKESKRLTVADDVIREGLVGLLGKEVYQNGELNKALLADYLFAAPENAAKVNAVIHPRVKADFKNWVKRQEGKDLVILESAILYESGFDDVVDVVVMVYAPECLRIERAMERDHATESQIRKRIAAQMNDEEKKNRADFVVVNDGMMALDSQLDCLVEQIKKSKYYQ